MSRKYAENHLLFLAMKKNYEGLNKIVCPQTKPWLFVDSSKKIKIDPDIMQTNIKIAEEELGKFSKEEQILFENAYKHRLFMGTPLNRA